MLCFKNIGTLKIIQQSIREEFDIKPQDTAKCFENTQFQEGKEQEKFGK